MTEMTPTAITEILSADTYDFYGLRTLSIVDADDKTREAPEIGSVLNNSRVWDDGEMTDEELDGTCAFGIRGDSDEAEVAYAMERFQREGYYGVYTVLVGGYRAQQGQDNGEIIIREATVLGVWARL